MNTSRTHTRSSPIDIFAAIDGTTLIAATAIVASAIAAAVGLTKARPEAISIATKSTLEVNESLRLELVETRKEAGELRGKLRRREEELETMQHKVNKLRREVDDLELEIATMREPPVA